MYEKYGDAGYVCRRCGISRPTLRKWYRRYQESGLEGLRNRSRRPKHSPLQKVNKQETDWILTLRKERNLGSRRLQNELKHTYQLSLSLSTIQKVLKRENVEPLKCPPRKKRIRRYSRPVPGERIQMDTCKIRPRLYQYTAIDDCTRYQVVDIFPNRNADNTIEFLEKVIEEMPFPIQRIQTDRGLEFFAYKVQEWLMESHIKFRPNRPAAPHLNGKVERAQKTDLEEFYTIVDSESPDLRDKLSEWQHYYNWYRIHGAIGKSPMDRYFELIDRTPLWDDVINKYDVDRERYRVQDYSVDRLIKK